MVTILLLLLGAAVVILSSGIRHTSRVHDAVAKHVGKVHMSQALTAFLVSVQFGELVRVIEHASIVNIIGSILVLAVILATKSGTDGELH